jgi:transposase
VRCAPLAQRPLADGLVVGLLPPQYVQPYVTMNKNDFRDAKAIAEAVGPTRRSPARLPDLLTYTEI